MQIIQMVINSEKEACKTAGGLGEQIKPHHNETTLSLQYCQLKIIRSLTSSA